MDLAIIFPADQGGGGDPAHTGSLGGREEIGLSVDRAVFDSVKDLKVFEAIPSLVAKSPAGSKATSFFPSAQSFVRQS